MFKLSVKRILEKLGKLNNLNPLTYMINGSKNKKLNFALFWPHVLGQTSQHWGRKNSNFSNFYWVISVCLTLYFQAWPGLTSCIIVLKEFISVFNKKAEKSTLSLFMVTVAKRNKMTLNTKNLVDPNYHWKNWVDWMSTEREEKLQPQKAYIFRKKAI